MKNKTDKNNEILVDGRTLTLIILTSNKSRGYLDRLFEKYKSEIYDNVKKKIKETKYVAEAGEIDLAFRTRKAIRLVNLLEFRKKESERRPTAENIKAYEEINYDIITAVMSISDPLRKAQRTGDLETYYKEFRKSLTSGNEEDVMINLAAYGLLNSHKELENPPPEHEEFKSMTIKLFKYFSAKREYEVKDMEKTVEARKKLGLDSIKMLGEIYRKTMYLCTDGYLTDDNCDMMNYMGYLTERCNLDFERFKNNTISRKEMNEIIDTAIDYSPEDIEEENLLVKIYLGMLIYLVNKAFENDRKLFFENTDAVYELENKIAEINEKEKLKEIEQLKNTISNKDSEIERLRNELRAVSLEAERNETKKSEEIDNLEELLINAYKSEFEVIETEEDIESEVIESDQDIGFVNITIDEVISVVGGYPSLINKLKEKMPNTNWIYKERQIKGNERNIFLLTNLVGHGMRYRLDSMNMEYTYVNGMSSNIIVKEIHDHLFNN